MNVKQIKITMFKFTFKNIMVTNAIPEIPKIMITHIMETHDISTNREIKLKRYENH